MLIVCVHVCHLSTFVQCIQVFKELFCLNHCVPQRGNLLLLGREPLQDLLHLHTRYQIQNSVTLIMNYYDL